MVARREGFHLQYFVQMERSSTSPHEDGYLRPFSLGTDVRVGSPSQGLCDYEDTRVEGPWEFGLMSSVGKRRGLEEAVDCVKAGMALSKVAEEFSWPG